MNDGPQQGFYPSQQEPTFAGLNLTAIVLYLVSSMSLNVFVHIDH